MCAGADIYVNVCLCASFKEIEALSAMLEIKTHLAI
jgi:hypothetical protein